MRRTGATAVLLLIGIGVAAGWLIQLALLSSAEPAFVPPLALAAVLVAPAIVVLLLAWPIRRGVRATVSVRIDPFHAVRVAGLAKACSAAGALFLGLLLGLALQLLVRTVVPGALVLQALVVALGAALLLAGGLLAEAFCSLPPPGEGDADAPAEPGAPGAAGARGDAATSTEQRRHP